MSQDLIDDWCGSFRNPDDNPDDAQIAGIVDMNATADELRQRPDYPAWLEAERTKARSPWAGVFDEDRAWLDYRSELGRRNDVLRSAHRRAQKCRRLLVDRCPRHGELVLSPGFDVAAPVIVAMAKWAKDPNRTIAVLSGPPGTGKTSGAAWWSLQHANGEPSNMPTWITASTFARSSRYDDDRDTVLDACALVLDDLAAEYADSKGSFLVDLDELIDRYYSRRARLVISTNLDAKAFEARYGARIFDRLAEAGTWIPVTGASRRRTAK